MTTSTSGVRRFRHVATGPDEAREFLEQAYGTRLRVGRPTNGDWRVVLDRLDAGVVTTGELEMNVDVTVDVDARDEYVFTSLLAGRSEFERSDRVERFAAGDVYPSFGPGSRLVGRAKHPRAHTVTLAAQLVRSVAAASADADPPCVTFLPHAASAAGAAQWNRTTRYVDELLIDLTADDSSLVVGPASRLLAATALTVFANTAVAEADDGDGRDHRSSTLRRAIAHMESHPDLDLTLADIARAAYVTPRALQLAFRRQLDTTPMAYLRRLRLDQAHRELRAASPDGNTTVSAVASRWGFTPSRFSRLYRAEYGRNPSQDLHG